MVKIALGIEYDGTLYCGWQKQKNISSIQSCIEHALYKISSKNILVFCAGRTDSGVHALGQVVHFESDIQYSKATWIYGINRYLPPSICVFWSSIVNKDFHARLSAVSRRYYYVIYNSYIRSAILFRKTWHYKKFLDIQKMYIAAQYLLGEKDFSVFRSSGCQSRSVYRKIYHVHIFRKGLCVVIDIKANAFLYHMVRNIVGSLVEIGCGNKPIIWILELLRNNNRDLAGVTAPANGLYLVEVEYPTCFSIPSLFQEKFGNRLNKTLPFLM